MHPLIGWLFAIDSRIKLDASYNLEKDERYVLTAPQQTLLPV